MSRGEQKIVYGENSGFTDELFVRFYECPCGFAYVPHGMEGPFKVMYDVEEATARFCPGCGCTIQWQLEE